MQAIGQELTCWDNCRNYHTMSCAIWRFEKPFTMFGEKIRECPCYDPTVGSPDKLPTVEYQIYKAEWVKESVMQQAPSLAVAPLPTNAASPVTEEEWVKQPLDQQVARTVVIVKGMQMRDGVSAAEKSEGSESLVGKRVRCQRCGEGGKVIRKFPHGKTEDAHLYVRHYDSKAQKPVDHYLVKEA